MLSVAVPPVPIDPVSGLGGMLTHLLGHFVETGRDDILHLLDRYLFVTVDSSRPGLLPLTSNAHLAGINGALAIAGDSLLVAVMLVSSLRSMFERSLRARYSLKVMLPRVLLAVIMMHGSLLFIQMALDLNNALSHFALGLGGGDMPWAGPLGSAFIQQLSLSQDLFHIVVALALVIAVVILGLAYIVRMAVLNVLIVTAPLAALASTLPETRSYARTWLRLFLVAVFMQALQIVVLRVAMVTGLAADTGLASTLYALATLWVTLKVPGALNTASHLESKAKTLGHELERHVRKAIAPAHHAVAHRSGS